MRLSFLPFLLLLLPLGEIAVFVLVGSEIGVLATIGLVVATAITGAILLRVQGLGTIARMRQVMDAGGTPGRELMHGAMILLAGILLLTPGFITDTLGFLLFIPAMRDAAWRLLRSRIVVMTPSAPAARRGGRTIDLDEEEYRREQDDRRDPPIDRRLP